MARSGWFEEAADGSKASPRQAQEGSVMTSRRGQVRNASSQTRPSPTLLHFLVILLFITHPTCPTTPRTTTIQSTTTVTVHSCSLFCLVRPSLSNKPDQSLLPLRKLKVGSCASEPSTQKSHTSKHKMAAISSLPTSQNKTYQITST